MHYKIVIGFFFIMIWLHGMETGHLPWSIERMRERIELLRTVGQRAQSARTVQSQFWANAECTMLLEDIATLIDMAKKVPRSDINQHLFLLDGDLRRLQHLILFSSLNKRRFRQSQQQAINYITELHTQWKPKIESAYYAQFPHNPKKFNINRKADTINSSTKYDRCCHLLKKLLGFVKNFFFWNILKAYFESFSSSNKVSEMSLHIKKDDPDYAYWQQYRQHQELASQLRAIGEQSVFFWPISVVQECVIRQRLIESRKKLAVLS